MSSQSKDGANAHDSPKSPKAVQRTTSTNESVLSSSPKTDWKEVKSKKSKSRSKAPTTEPSDSAQAVGSRRDVLTHRERRDTETSVDNTELEFQFDEELTTSQWTNGRKNQFTEWSDDDDSDYEISDTELAQIIVITQTAGTRLSKHEGYDRTGDWTTRVKMTQELSHVINDGLFYYEQDLWGLNDKHDTKPHKTIELISQEAFEKYSPNQKPKSVKGVPPPPPPPPPPTYQEESYMEKHMSGKWQSQLLLIATAISSLSSINGELTSRFVASVSPRAQDPEDA